MFGLFKNRAQHSPEKAEIETHQHSLKFFRKNQASLGCYSGSVSLREVEDAIDFFALGDFTTTVTLRAELDEVLDLMYLHWEEGKIRGKVDMVLRKHGRIK